MIKAWKHGVIVMVDHFNIMLVIKAVVKLWVGLVVDSHICIMGIMELLRMGVVSKIRVKELTFVN